jgi:hypothetical protein
MTSLATGARNLKLSAWLAGREVSEDSSDPLFDQPIAKSWDDVCVIQLKKLYEALVESRLPNELLKKCREFSEIPRLKYEDYFESLSLKKSYPLLSSFINLAYLGLLGKLDTLASNPIASDAQTRDRSLNERFIKLSEDLGDAIALCNTLSAATEKFAKLESDNVPGLTPVSEISLSSVSEDSSEINTSAVLEAWSNSAWAALNSALSEGLEQGRDQAPKENLLPRYRQLLEQTVSSIKTVTMTADSGDNTPKTLTGEADAFKALATNITELQRFISSCNFSSECANLAPAS